MSGPEEVGYEGFSYPNWNNLSNSNSNNTSSNNIKSNASTPKQTFYSQSSPQNVNSSNYINTSNGSNNNINSINNTNNNNMANVTNTSAITHVPSSIGSYFHQRSVSKNNFAPFVSPTNTPSSSSSSYFTAGAAGAGTNTAITTATTTSPTPMFPLPNSNINNNNNNNSSSSVKCKNAYESMISSTTNFGSVANNYNMFTVMTSASAQRNKSSTSSTSSTTFPEHPLRQSQPVSSVLGGNSSNPAASAELSKLASASNTTKATTPLLEPYTSQQQQQQEQRISTPQSNLFNVNVQQSNSNSNNSKNAIKPVFRQHDAASVDFGVQETKPFMPFIQNSLAPQLTTSPFATRSQNSNNNNNINMAGNYANMNGLAQPISQPHQATEADPSTMSFFNRTNVPLPSPPTLLPATTTTTTTATALPISNVLFASPSFSNNAPFIQESNNITSNNNIINNNIVGGNQPYILPHVMQQQQQQQQQEFVSKGVSLSNELRHRKHRNEEHETKHSNWLMTALLNRLLRRGDDVESDYSNEDNVDSNEENNGYDSNYNGNNGINDLLSQNDPSRPRKRKSSKKPHSSLRPRPLYQTRFGNPEDDLPLLTELGIYPANILRKALVVLNPLQSIPHEIITDTDLTGPLIFAIALALLLSLHGKIQFSAVYGLCVLGMFFFKLLLSLMHDKSVPVQFIMSALGYALLPNVILAFIRNLQYWLIGSFNRVLLPAAIVTILWSSWCATTLLVKGQGMETQRYLVLYPVILFYAIFAALTIF